MLAQSEVEISTQISESNMEDDIEVPILDESDGIGFTTRVIMQYLLYDSVSIEDELSKAADQGMQERRAENVNVNSIEDKKTESSSESETESKYPDTHIKIQHFGGVRWVQLIICFRNTYFKSVFDRRQILTEPLRANDIDDEEENIIYLGDNKPVVLKPSQNKGRSRGPSESSNRDRGSNSKSQKCK